MNFKHPLILASSSPRRQFLLREIGFQFTIAVPGIDESFPPDMPVMHVPCYLAEKKAKFVGAKHQSGIVLAADTIVVLENKILNKPVDRADAIRMLSMLSGKTHTVITAVCLYSPTKTDNFQDTTRVTFRNLTPSQIASYIDHYKPLDKAGAYGAQDCLPDGMDPCSQEEKYFLKLIGQPQLANVAMIPGKGKERVVIIEKIDGSYFTVMGLPIHLVYEHLMRFRML